MLNICSQPFQKTSKLAYKKVEVEYSNVHLPIQFREITPGFFRAF